MLEELLICYMSMKLQIFSQFYAIDTSAILNAEDISGTNFEYVRSAEKQMTMNFGFMLELNMGLLNSCFFLRCKKMLFRRL